MNEADAMREDDERARKFSYFIQSVVAAQVRSRIGGAVSPLHRIPYEHIGGQHNLYLRERASKSWFAVHDFKRAIAQYDTVCLRVQPAPTLDSR